MSVTKQDIERFHASLDRASSDPLFLDTFYDGFMSSSGEVRQYFKHTDMDRLKRKLKSSLHMMTLLVDQSPGVEMYMTHLSRVHDSYHIPAHLYQLWLEVLIKAVRHCDREFEPQLEKVWRDVLGEGIALMESGIGSHDATDPSKTD